MKAGIIGRFGDHDNGRRGIEFCAERRLCLGNTCFEHESLLSTPGWLHVRIE